MLRLVVLSICLCTICWSAPDWQADYQQALAHGVARRLLVGYPDMTFRPTQAATRYEGAAVFSRLVWYYDLELPEPALLAPDVPWDHWCADACRVMHASRLAPEPKGVRYAGDELLTRGEFALVEWNLVQVLGKDRPLKHLSDVDDPYGQAAKALVEMGLLTTYPDGGLYLAKPMPRWQICIAVHKLLVWVGRDGGPLLWGPVMYVPNAGGRRPE